MNSALDNIEPEDRIVTQEQVGTRVIYTYDTHERILVDDDYDGELFANHYRWRLFRPSLRQLSPYVHGFKRGSSSKLPGRWFYLHRLVAGEVPKGMWVTHKNGDTLDNRSTNITLITPSQSALTRKQSSLLTSKRPVARPYRGVEHGLDENRTYYVTFRGVYQGTYATAEEAAQAYDELAYSTYGEKATLNFPAEYDL
jgi:hypothetical protein